MKNKYYSKLTEFASNEFTNCSLIPSAVLKRSYEAIDEHFSYFYWNMLHRIKEKKITFEQLQIFISILNQPSSFPDDSRLLILTRIPTVAQKTRLQYEADLYKSVEPFEKIASYRAVAQEFNYTDPDKVLFAAPSKDLKISKELADFAPEAQEDQNLIKVSRLLSELREYGEWLGPVETEQLAIADYCQYAQLAIFMNYVGPVINVAKQRLFRWLKVHHVSQYPQNIATKIDYLNWKCWIYLMKTFYLNDRFYIRTYYLNSGEKYYIKHELYTKQPEMLVNIIVEEYST